MLATVKKQWQNFLILELIINVHLKNIFARKELDINSTIEDNRKVKFYSIDAIISVG